MDSGDSACPEQGFDDGGSEPDSSGSVNVGTSEKCVVCGLDTAEPLSRVGRGISSFLDQCTAIGRTDLVEFIRCNPDICPVGARVFCGRSVLKRDRRSRFSNIMHILQ